MSSPLARTAVLLGAPIDDVTVDGAVELIGSMVERGRSEGRVHQVATVNVDFLVNACGAADILEVLQRTDLSLPDGMPVVWAARMMGTPLAQRTTGVDLVPALAEQAARRGHRLLLFGGAAGVAANAADLLAQRFGGQVTGIEGPRVAADGSMPPDWVDVLREVDADIVGVALGNPKQERWIERHAESVGAPVFIGIGGTLDFLTGVTRRAPDWMQRGGLEWLHRAMSEPRRLAGRYARDLRVFAPAIARQAWHGRRRGQAIAPLVVAAEHGVRMRVLGPLPQAEFEPAVRASVRAGDSVSIDVGTSGEIDNVTLSRIVGLVRLGRTMSAPVTVRAPDAASMLARLTTETIRRRIPSGPV